MIPERNEATLLRVAAAVADDEAVDWERETSDDASLFRKVQNIRLIQSISAAHRDAREEVLHGTPSAETAQGPMWGKLQLLQRLGTGAFGEVYRAWDPDLRCEVALKLPAAGAAGVGEPGDRFLREARQLARVKHENVVRVLGADSHDGRVGIWTELIEGRTLEEHLSDAGRFSADEAASIGIELCRALAAVHAAGMIHRDVKTTNVLREEGGRIVLLDFSAAANRLPNRGEAQTRQQPLSGTPRFMAPELFRGGPAGVRSDLYSLGVLLYRLVTVDYPVDATTFEELAEGQERGECKPLRDRRPDLAGPFVQVVERLLAADPAQRFGSAGETERALDAARTGRPTAVNDAATHSRETLGDRASRDRRLFAVLSVVAALVLAVLGFTMRERLFPGPLTVETAFFATAEDMTTRRLKPLAPIHRNDVVHLELTVSHDAHAYVMNHDEAGNQYVLFPGPDAASANPLEANRRHRLPDDGIGWSMTEPGDVETIVVVVSKTPLEQVETVIAGLPAAGGVARMIAAEGNLRGLGGVRPQPGAPADASAVSRLSEQLGERAKNDADLWVETYYFRGRTE